MKKKTKVKKAKLPFSVKKFDKGAEKLHKNLKKLKKEWSHSKTLPKRKKEIDLVFKNVSLQWNKLLKVVGE